MSKTVSINNKLAERLDEFRPIPVNGRQRTYSEVIEMAMDLLEDASSEDQNDKLNLVTKEDLVK